MSQKHDHNHDKHQQSDPVLNYMLYKSISDANKTARQNSEDGLSLMDKIVWWVIIIAFLWFALFPFFSHLL